MSERITRKDVDRIAATVSEGLRNGQEIHAQGRNGYIGLDLYADAAAVARGTPVDTLKLGTTREIYTYLQGMRRCQLLTRYGA